MAIPSLPTAKNTNDIIDNAWVDAVRDLLALFRDDRPAFYGRNLNTGSGGQTVATGTDTQLEFSDGAASSAFNVTPVVNVGGWVSKDLGNGIVVPETGLYQVTGWAQFALSAGGTLLTTGVRRVWLIDGGAEIGGSRIAGAPTGSASVAASFSTTALRFFTAGDELGIEVQQNSGEDQIIAGWLNAVWVGSSAS